MHWEYRGGSRILDLVGLKEQKWRAKRAAILATPIFAHEKRPFPPFSGLYTLNTVLEGSTEGVTVSTCIK